MTKDKLLLWVSIGLIVYGLAGFFGLLPESPLSDLIWSKPPVNTGEADLAVPDLRS